MGIKEDPFKEYFKEGEATHKELHYAWQTGVGLQAVDQLEPSPYLIDTAKKILKAALR